MTTPASYTKKMDLKDLEEWRNVIPEYVKDYVSLNTFL